ncbi:MFS transporter [Janibacter indicus]|uniref:Predicted arabinose efflux permease, MFS family n=1 Tax=Janibacter indicus TaxID=857417 RepID=A0A1W2BHC9_9MICO|nr:MFS transporter [Janibacter indicus]SMC72160.1 Predicted arabinose efflux permease, MFS family [Janibacter indicus]
MSPTFASLSIRNYRIYALGAIVSNVGTWMGRVAQDWVVLTELTDHSASALGIVTGLQFLPMLLLAPWTGAVVDRFPKRSLLLLTQAVLGLTALVGGVLVVTGAAQLWHFYLLALMTGVATAFDNPARQTFVSEMVPRERLSNAVALNSASFNLGRLIGPAVAGLVIAGIGSGQALLVNSLSFVTVIVALLALRASELTPAPRVTGRGSAREGLRYVRGRPDIILVMVLIFVLGTFGMNFQITIALMATQVFGRGAEGYGLLGSIMAVGSLSAALLAARRSEPRLRVLLLSLVGFTFAAAGTAIAPTYASFAVALAACGLTALTAMTTANAMVQMRTDPMMRGRVMALYMAIFFGGTPLGAPIIGWVGDVLGPRWTIGIGAAAVGITLVGVSIWLGRHENVEVTYSSQRRPRVRVSSAPTHDVPQAAR